MRVKLESFVVFLCHQGQGGCKESGIADFSIYAYHELGIKYTHMLHRFNMLIH